MGNSGCRREKVRRHEGQAERFHRRRSGRGIEEVETSGQNVVGKPVHVDDGRRNPPSPAIGREVRAWVKEDLMPLMGKESGGSRQQPPVAIAGGSGVVDVADGSLRA